MFTGYDLWKSDYRVGLIYYFMLPLHNKTNFQMTCRNGRLQCIVIGTFKVIPQDTCYIHLNGKLSFNSHLYYV